MKTVIQLYELHSRISELNIMYILQCICYVFSRKYISNITKYKTDTPISIYYLVNSPYIVYRAHNKGQDSFFLYKWSTTTYFHTLKSSCAWAIDSLFIY